MMFCWCRFEDWSPVLRYRKGTTSEKMNRAVSSPPRGLLSEAQAAHSFRPGRFYLSGIIPSWKPDIEFCRLLAHDDIVTLHEVVAVVNFHRERS